MSRFDPDFLETAKLAYLAGPDMPVSVDQFFGPLGEQTWSVWLQTKGEFRCHINICYAVFQFNAYIKLFCCFEDKADSGQNCNHLVLSCAYYYASAAT